MTEQGKTVRYLVTATVPFTSTHTSIEAVTVEVPANCDLKLEAREAAARGVNEIAHHFDWNEGDGNEWPPSNVYVLRLLDGQMKCLNAVNAETGPAPDHYVIAEMQCCGGQPMTSHGHSGWCPEKPDDDDGEVPAP